MPCCAQRASRCAIKPCKAGAHTPLLSTGTVLMHGGGSGVGTAAIRIAKELGNRIIVTAGSKEKCSQCVSLGANAVINYRSGPSAAENLCDLSPMQC